MRKYGEAGTKKKMITGVDEQSWHSLKVASVTDAVTIGEKLHEILEHYFEGEKDEQ